MSPAGGCHYDRRGKLDPIGGNPPGVRFPFSHHLKTKSVSSSSCQKNCLNHSPCLRGLRRSHLVCKSFASAPTVASSVCWRQVAEQLAAVSDGIEVVGCESERVSVGQAHVDWFAAEVAGPPVVAGCFAQFGCALAVCAVTVLGRSRHSRTCFR